MKRLLTRIDRVHP